MQSLTKQRSCQRELVEALTEPLLKMALPGLLGADDQWPSVCVAYEETVHVQRLAERATALDGCSAKTDCKALAGCAGPLWKPFLTGGDATTTLGALRRAVVGAFERSDPTHGDDPSQRKLCASAPPVPAVVPHGKPHAPSTKEGEDFNRGDDATGWACLRFGLNAPMSYQLTYRAGGPYKGPAEGGPDPGPEGFEVAAEGDLDGDGIRSLVTWTGSVDANHELVVAPAPFVVRPRE